MVATIFGLPVIALGMSHGAFAKPEDRWIQLALTAVVASAAMALSSVSVVTNSLRFRRFAVPG